MHKLLLTTVLLSTLALAACSGEPKGDAPKARDAAKMPDVFRVEFDTTAGKFTVEAHQEWSPKGVERFWELVQEGFFEDIAFFRVIPGFMVQFGIHGDPEQSKTWSYRTIEDEPVKQSNTRGMLSYAMAPGPNTRTTQMFINFGDNSNLDNRFAPFAKVVSPGMLVVDKIYQVGECGPRGPGPSQQKIRAEGNAYMKKAYPKITYIKSAKVLK